MGLVAATLVCVPFSWTGTWIAAPSNLLVWLGAPGLFVALVLVAAIITAPVVIAANAIFAERDDRGVAAYAAALLLLGAIAECTFFIYRANAAFGHLFVGIIILGSWTCAGAILERLEIRLRLLRPDAWLPWAISLAAALLYVLILVETTKPGSDVLLTSASAWWAFPSDNVLPEILARQAHDGLPLHPFANEWLSSDRPPLQSGFDLMTMWLFPLPATYPIRYEGLGIWLQCWSFGALFVLARACGFDRRPSLHAVLCCVLTSFFFINGIFIWPKLVTIAFGATAIAVIMSEDLTATLRTRFMAAGALFAFGMLFHGGLIFTAPALIAAAILRYRKTALTPLLMALGIMIVILDPWLAYQKFVDPPGDRLVKWHLGGQEAVDTSRTAARVIIDAYKSKNAGEITSMKLQNVTGLWPQYGYSRTSEFFSPVLAVGILWFPLGWLLIGRQLTRAERAMRNLLLIGIASIFVWCALMWTGTVIHTGSYLTMALLLFPAALISGRRRIFALFTIEFLTLDIGINWMAGIVPPMGLAIDGTLIALIAVLLNPNPTIPDPSRGDGPIEYLPLSSGGH